MGVVQSSLSTPIPSPSLAILGDTQWSFVEPCRWGHILIQVCHTHTHSTESCTLTIPRSAVHTALTHNEKSPPCQHYHHTFLGLPFRVSS